MENQFCYCGRLGKIATSWTASNPGRRFIGCELYGKAGACGYFMWADPSMCNRATVVIPGLLRSLQRHEAQERAYRKTKILLVMALISSWVLFVIMLTLLWL